jgi:hypothetical protein
MASQSDDDSSNSTVTANVSTSFGVFIIITIIYTIVKIMFGVVGDKMWIFGYLLIIVIIQWQLNSMIASDNCNDTDQFTTTIIATFLPWIGIFFTINVLLLIFPGWKAPFSNTLGYFIAYMAGVKSAFVKMLKTSESIDQSNINDKALLKSIEYIYNDTSTMINEMNTENFEDTIHRLKPLLNEEAINDPSMKNDLFKFIIMKDSIGELVWLLLSGCMAINVAYVYIINTDCVTTTTS